jgi:hypothetical protein
MRWWTFGLHKMRGISWLAEEILASQEGFWSMYLVCLLVGWLVGWLVNGSSLSLGNWKWLWPIRKSSASFIAPQVRHVYHIASLHPRHHTTAVVLSETTKETPRITLTFAWTGSGKHGRAPPVYKYWSSAEHRLVWTYWSYSSTSDHRSQNTPSGLGPTTHNIGTARSVWI